MVDFTSKTPSFVNEAPVPDYPVANPKQDAQRSKIASAAPPREVPMTKDQVIKLIQQNRGGGSGGLSAQQVTAIADQSAATAAAGAVVTADAAADARWTAENPLSGAALDGSELVLAQAVSGSVRVPLSQRLEAAEADYFNDPACYKELAIAIKSGAAKIVFVGDSLLFGYQSNARMSPINILERKLKLLYPTCDFTFIDRSLPGHAIVNLVNPGFKPSDSYTASVFSVPNEPGKEAWDVGTIEEHNYRWPEGAKNLTVDSWATVIANDQPDLIVMGLGFNDVHGGLSLKAFRDYVIVLNNYMAALRTTRGNIPSIAYATPHNGNVDVLKTTQNRQDKLRGMNNHIRQVCLSFPMGLLDTGRHYDRHHRGVDPHRVQYDVERYMVGYTDSTKWREDSFGAQPQSSPITGSGTSGVVLDSTGKHLAASYVSLVRLVPCVAMSVRANIRKLATANDVFQVITGGVRDGSTVVPDRQVISFFNTGGVGKCQWVMDNNIMQTVDLPAPLPTNGTDNYWVEVVYDGYQIYVWVNGNTTQNTPDAVFQYASHLHGFPCIGYQNALAAPAVRVTDITMKIGKECLIVPNDTTNLESFGTAQTDEYLTELAPLGGDGGAQQIHYSTKGEAVIIEPAVAAMVRSIAQAVSRERPAFRSVSVSTALDQTLDKGILNFNSASDRTVTLPSPATGTIAAGFECEVFRSGAGLVNVVSADGDALFFGDVGALSIPLNCSVRIRMVAGIANQYYWFVTSSATPSGTSGTYVPTITVGANVTAATNANAQYMRVGNVVTVSGQVQIDVTAASATTSIGISLPIASALAQPYQLAGTAHANTIPDASGGMSAAIMADNINDRANLLWENGTHVTNEIWVFHFTYLIV